MEDTLKRLLEAEREAEAIIAEATRERDRILEDARRQGEEEERSFESRIPQMRVSRVKEATQRAQREGDELVARAQRRKQELQELADRGAEQAIEATLKIVLEGSED